MELSLCWQIYTVVFFGLYVLTPVYTLKASQLLPVISTGKESLTAQ